MSDGLIADPAIGASTLAAPAIPAASGSYRYSSRAFGLGIHAF